MKKAERERERERERDGNNLMMHSWVGRWGQPILQIKMIDEFLMASRRLFDHTREHSTFINSLTELLKTKTVICKNTHEKSTGLKNKKTHTKPNMMSQNKSKCFHGQNTVCSDFLMPTTPSIVLYQIQALLLPPQTGPLKSTYPQDFKDAGDGRAPGRVQTSV